MASFLTHGLFRSCTDAMFEYELFSTGSWIECLVLTWKALETLGSGFYLEEVGH
jgi:hypothetical protein